MVMILSPSSFDRRVNLAIRLFPAYFAASKNSFFSEDSLFLCKRRNEEAHHRPVIAMLESVTEGSPQHTGHFGFVQSEGPLHRFKAGSIGLTPQRDGNTPSVAPA
jgi:hypothetical protein